MASCLLPCVYKFLRAANNVWRFYFGYFTCFGHDLQIICKVWPLIIIIQTSINVVWKSDLCVLCCFPLEFSACAIA